MAIKVSTIETINALKAIFEKHRNDRVCIIGTTCCGKTTLLRKIPECVDMDELLKKHCDERGVNFADAKSMKVSVEEDWNEHRIKGEKLFYYLTINE